VVTPGPPNSAETGARCHDWSVHIRVCPRYPTHCQYSAHKDIRCTASLRACSNSGSRNISSQPRERGRGSGAWRDLPGAPPRRRSAASLAAGENAGSGDRRAAAGADDAASAGRPNELPATTSTHAHSGAAVAAERSMLQGGSPRARACTICRGTEREAPQARRRSRAAATRAPDPGRGVQVASLTSMREETGAAAPRRR
jgi:hypothetical protein